jgi:hypothetical protein
MKRYLLPLAALVIAPSIATASAVSYNYVDVRYVDVDGPLDGVGAEISGSISPNLFLRGGFSLLSGRGLDVDTLRAEIGYHTALNPQVDLLGTIGAIYSEIDPPGSSKDDDTGLTMSGGLRAMLAPQIEGSAIVRHDRIFSSSNTDFTLGGLFHINNQWAVGASYTFDSDDTITVGGRFNY